MKAHGDRNVFVRSRSTPRRPPVASLLGPPLLLLLASAAVLPSALGNTSTRAEKRRYTSDDVPDSGPRFEDYHRLLDHYYAEGMTEDELYDALRETMAYRLSLPQRYYAGAGYIPGVDEGTIPTVDDGKGGRRQVTEEEYWKHRGKDEKRVKEQRKERKKERQEAK